MREPKPFFRKSTRSWYFKQGKKFIPLGKDKEEAHKKYHALMSASQPTTPDTRVEDLLGKFLTWCQAHKAPGTHRWYTRHLTSLRGYLLANHGKLTVSRIKPSHISDWLDTLGGGDNYKNGAHDALSATCGCEHVMLKQSGVVHGLPSAQSLSVVQAIVALPAAPAFPPIAPPCPPLLPAVPAVPDAPWPPFRISIRFYEWFFSGLYSKRRPQAHTCCIRDIV